jgi:hypothetical protein
VHSDHGVLKKIDQFRLSKAEIGLGLLTVLYLGDKSLGLLLQECNGAKALFLVYQRSVALRREHVGMFGANSLDQFIVTLLGKAVNGISAVKMK